MWSHIAHIHTHIHGGSAVVSVKLFFCTNTRKNIFKLSNVILCHQVALFL